MNLTALSHADLDSQNVQMSFVLPTMPTLSIPAVPEEKIRPQSLQCS